MQVVFRTDASNTIGTGHITRCLNLAHELQERGACILFICRHHEGHFCDLIKEQGFEIHWLSKPLDDFVPNDNIAHATWLGAPWHEDATSTEAIIRTIPTKTDWLIVDHYGIDYRWENQLRSLVDNIMVIDDLADRIHNCDILLDQNLVKNYKNRYNHLVPGHCIQLLGPNYALLQPIYAKLHTRIPPRAGSIQRILISFGGVDFDNLTGLVLNAFISLNRSDIKVDVVLSKHSPHLESIQQQLSIGHPNIHIYSTLPSLSNLIVKADLAIGAAGITNWERLCLGLPAIIVIIADNQEAIANWLHHEGLVILLGHKDKLSKYVVLHTLTKMINEGLEQTWSQKCHQIVDGKGVERVSEILTINPNKPLKVREVQLNDEKLLLSWANDPETRRQSFSPDFISEEEHRKWFWNRLRQVDTCKFFIIESERNTPIGQVRFDKYNDGWDIDYSLAPQFRRRGLGKPLLKAAIEMLLREEHNNIILYSTVKVRNIPSIKIFESLEFKLHIQEGDNREYKFVN